MENCSPEFKPIFYRRFVDDTFALLRHQSHASLLLDYINKQHRNLKFTMKLEKGGSLGFLDCLITKHDGRLESLVFRKTSFTGLGISLFSFTPQRYKMNAISTLINRAYNICSSHTILSKELSYLQRFFFQSNGFPIKVIISRIQLFIKNKIGHKLSYSTVLKKQQFLSFML